MLESFKQELKAYAQRSKEAQEIAERFLAFIERTPQCLNRNNLPGHLTASAWIENRTGDRFLLTKHKKAGFWYQLGGHVEDNPNILEEAFREAREESGLKHLILKQEGIFDLGMHFVTYGDRPHVHYDTRYLLKAMDADEAIQISDESDDLAWFSTLPEGSDDLEGLFAKWQESKNRPQSFTP